MRYRDEEYDLRVQYRVENHELSEQEKAEIEVDLESLRRVVSDFPVADLHVDIRRHPQQGDFHVKANLRLPSTSLFTGERDSLLVQACECCVRKLIKKVKGFKEKLSLKATYAKAADGTFHELFPAIEPEVEQLEVAARERDFDAFREAIAVYDDSLEGILGRRIERYPDLASQLGEGFVLSDLVDEIYRKAFEGFLERPADRLGNWIDGLIDPTLRTFAERAGVVTESEETVPD